MPAVPAAVEAPVQCAGDRACPGPVRGELGDEPMCAWHLQLFGNSGIYAQAGPFSGHPPDRPRKQARAAAVARFALHYRKIRGVTVLQRAGAVYLLRTGNSGNKP